MAPLQQAQLCLGEPIPGQEVQLLSRLQGVRACSSTSLGDSHFAPFFSKQRSLAFSRLFGGLARGLVDSIICARSQTSMRPVPTKARTSVSQTVPTSGIEVSLLAPGLSS